MVASIDWATALERVKQYSFKIMTPQSSGTGFLITYRRSNEVCGVATAYHVIKHAHDWDQPIKLIHTPTKKEVLLRPDNRVVIAKPEKDVAIILFVKGSLELETKTLPLAPKNRYLKPGVEIAWAGYPDVAPDHFSFFSGHISCFLDKEGAYLVDGVAIKGVSGGPSFGVIAGKQIDMVGVVSAYIPSRAKGETLPGVCFIVGIHPFYEFIQGVQSLEEAKEKASDAAYSRE